MKLSVILMSREENLLPCSSILISHPNFNDYEPLYYSSRNASAGRMFAAFTTGINVPINETKSNIR